MSLLDTIYQGRTCSTVLKWPGTEHRVKMSILGKADMQDATFAASRRLNAEDVGMNLANLESLQALLKEEETIQILYRSLTDMEGNPVTASIDDFRARLSTDDVDELSRAYTVFEAEVSPNLDAMEEKEFNAFLEGLKKKPEEMLGSVRSIAFARRLLRSLAVPPPI